jgi:hypothetical protein
MEWNESAQQRTHHHAFLKIARPNHTHAKSALIFYNHSARFEQKAQENSITVRQGADQSSASLVFFPPSVPTDADK